MDVITFGKKFPVNNSMIKKYIEFWHKNISYLKKAYLSKINVLIYIHRQNPKRMFWVLAFGNIRNLTLNLKWIENNKPIENMKNNKYKNVFSLWNKRIYNIFICGYNYIEW
jgi:hypothetical protein